MAPATTPVLDPAAPGFIDNPYPTYDELREAAPVHLSSKLKAWVLTRHSDAETFFKHPLLTADRTKAARFQGAPSSGQFRTLMTDGPGYTSLRTLAARFLTVREVAKLRPKVESSVVRLLDALDGKDTFDLVRDFAFPLPVAVIADLLGVPEEARDSLWAWSHRTAAGMDHYNRRTGTIDAPTLDLAETFRELTEHRRKDPQDDFISKLVTSSHRGDSLQTAEIVALCSGLLFAGHETTTNLLANGVLALLNDEDELGRLRGGTARIDTAVEELLRFEAPAHAISRVALDDLEIDGAKIAKGDIVLGLLGAMNRDPEVFEDPHALKLDRSPNPHVAFGEGNHFCWGAPLTRLEGAVAFPALLERFPKLRLDGDPVRRPTLILRGLASLPLATS